MKIEECEGCRQKNCEPNTCLPFLKSQRKKKPRPVEESRECPR